MMELGNQIFGNARGQYPIIERSQWEDIFFPLLQKAKLDDRGYGDYIDDTNTTFNNDVFTIRPYYWGDDDYIASLPNFVYKPLNFSIEWYKYPFRDSYCNEQITIEQFKDIIEHCIKSIQE